MQKLKVQIETEFITLTNLLKFAGVVMSGGQAHELIEEGLVRGSLSAKSVKKSAPAM